MGTSLVEPQVFGVSAERHAVCLTATCLACEPFTSSAMPEELRIIDTWRFAKRMPSRAADLRELFKRGLAAEGFTEVQDGQKSKDFSVLSDRTAE